jgi:hypothetical protein
LGLVQAQAFAHAADVPPRMLIKIAHVLVAHGDLDLADKVLARIESAGILVADLKAASRQLRRSGVLSRYRPIDHHAGEGQGPEILVSRSATETDRLVVVFSGQAKRFWLSLQVLDRFLAPCGANVLYLSDQTGKAFLNGLSGSASGYDGLKATIEKIAGEFACSRLLVMATSIGGFVGLRAAADLGAESFLGLGITSDFSPDGTMAARRIGAELMEACADKSLLINLRTYLADKPYPRRALIVCGDGHADDVTQAENLRGLPRFEVLYLPRFNSHGVVMGLLARGQFESVLSRFLGDADSEARA